MARASEQLERLLYILPVATREEGAHVDELARALEVDRETVLHDLEEATARAYYHPAGFVEEFTIFIEGDVVRVHAPADFLRPVRLSPREALALGLGLRALAAEAEPERRAEILGLATQLEHELAAPAAGEPLEVELGEDEVRGRLSDAIATRHVCSITYLSPSAREPVEREIKPLRLVFASGHWYVAALVEGSDDSRIYRLDRVLALQESAQTFEPVASDALEAAVRRSGEAFVAREAAAVNVRYTAKIARWIAEQHREALVTDDGEVVLTHRVSDRDWLVRHVLRYGGEAVVETPAYRSAVARAAADILAAVAAAAFVFTTLAT